ncbi:MAG: DMT family transporter [Actinomycetota bacterium]|nr:DMT family transporter [Actinomycetota bacterium]
MKPSQTNILHTTLGTHRQSFGYIEWGLLIAVGGIWGSSFLFIAEGLESFQPAFITTGRFALGFVTLAAFPAARRPIERSDWPAISILAFTWMALPMSLFPVAQQWISSSLAGMINGAVPLFAAVGAAVLLRKKPARVQILGLGIGFTGVALVSAPSGSSTENGYLGVGLLLFAVMCYGLAINLAVPLQQRYGALPVLLRALGLAAVMTLPFALFVIPEGEVSLSSSLALIALGALGTGIAFVAMQPSSAAPGLRGGPSQRTSSRSWRSCSASHSAMSPHRFSPFLGSV